MDLLIFLRCKPTRVFIAFGFLALASAVGLPAQGRSVGPVCDQLSPDYLRCAIAAADIDDLAYPRKRSADRELRFWTVGGIEPDHLVILRQHGDSIGGQLYRVWQTDRKDTTGLDAMCGLQRWTSANGDVCVARREPPPDWASIWRGLDSLGVASLPVDPSFEQPCYPGQPYDARICGHRDPIYFNSLEVRAAGVYWRYRFTGRPDSTTSAGKRDNAILRLLSCAWRSPRPAWCSS